MTLAARRRSDRPIAAAAAAVLMAPALLVLVLYTGERQERSIPVPLAVKRPQATETRAAVIAGRRTPTITQRDGAAKSAVVAAKLIAPTATGSPGVTQRRQAEANVAAADSSSTISNRGGRRAGKSSLQPNGPFTTPPVTPTTTLRERFAPLITADEKARSLRNLFELTALLENAGVSYFVFCGTLVGAYRHHGMVPWDDDVDIIANASQRRLIERTLSDRPGYGLHATYEYTYKWFGFDGVAAGDRPFKWPYVDIFFFAENDTHVFDIEVPYGRDHVYNKNDVLPLVYRPFEGGLLRAPANASAVLAVNYNVSQCRSAEYLHRSEENVAPERQFATDCANLHSLYPFVFCTKTAGSACVEEHLRVNGKTVGVYSPAAEAAAAR